MVSSAACDCLRALLQPLGLSGEDERDHTFRELAESAPLGVVVTDPAGRTVYANEAGQWLSQPSGKTSESFLEQLERSHLREPASARPVGVSATPIARALSGESPDESEYLIRLPGESTDRWLYSRAAAVIGEDQRVLGAVSIFWAEGGVRGTTVEMASSSAELHFLLNASRRLLGSHDVDGLLLEAAKCSVPELGTGAAVALLRDDGSLQTRAAHVTTDQQTILNDWVRRHSCDPARPNVFSRACATGTPQVFVDVSDSDLASGEPDAASRGLLNALDPKSLLVVPLLDGNDPIGFITLLSQDAARRYTSNDLRLATELANLTSSALVPLRLLEQAEQELGYQRDRLASVVHDLKTPLASIRLRADLLDRDIAAGKLAMDQLTASLADIGSASMRMAQSLNELLDLSRMESGVPIALRLSKVNLSELALEAAQQHQHGSECHIRVETCSQLIVGMWDEGRVRRVIDNLIDNAVKYSPYAGEIVLQTLVEEQGGDTWAALNVADHGLGIPAADHDRIFERYFRARNVIDRVPGTGLGLMGARHIVELHGGSLAFSSKEDQGTRFTLRLPLQT